jgi:hypothetical protein
MASDAVAYSLVASAEGTALSIWRSPGMSLRADNYRERAAQAKNRAAQARDPSVKRAFEEVANGWLVLAEQVEWIDRQRSPVRDEESDRSVR